MVFYSEMTKELLKIFEETDCEAEKAVQGFLQAQE